MGLAGCFEPPCVAVIFASQRTEGDRGYGAMADRMVALAAQQPGFLGVESARDPEGFGITVSYWKDEAAVAAWKVQADHALAQRLGKETWYSAFRLRVAKVERDSGRG
jgi:heme-degrading monooxygenase HmoA